MAPVVIVIPHQLSKADARQRIESHLTELLGQYGSQLDHLDHHWNGDTLDFQGGIMGMTILGKLQVEDQSVRVELMLLQTGGNRENRARIPLCFLCFLLFEF